MTIRFNIVLAVNIADVLSRYPVNAEEAPAPETRTEECLLVGVVEAPGTQAVTIPASWGWDPAHGEALLGEDQDLLMIQAHFVR